MRKNFLSMVIAMTMLFGLSVFVTMTAESSSLTLQYGSNGKFLSPIEPPVAGSTAISTRAQLEAIKNNLGGKYHLVNDINLSGTQWTPIGDNSTNSTASRFTGTFDGQGYVIRNLTITSYREYAGLFGYVYAATIKNVGFEGTNINITSSSSTVNAGAVYGRSIVGTTTNCYNTGSVTVDANNMAYAGGIAGWSSYGLPPGGTGTISYCYNTGNITVKYEGNAGGICGDLSSPNVISNCYNSGIIYAHAFMGNRAGAGGICGSNSGTITNCYNTNRVSVYGLDYQAATYAQLSLDAGGISGINHGGSTSVSNCYNTGQVFADSYNTYKPAYRRAGGITGHNQVTLSNCYSTGDVGASIGLGSSLTGSSNAGAICGYLQSGNLTNCYWNIAAYQFVNGDYVTNANKKGVGDIWSVSSAKDTTISLTSAQMKVQANFTGFNFNDNWAFVQGDNDGYPVLKAFYYFYTPTLNLSVSPAGSQTHPGNIVLTAVLSGADSNAGKQITFTVNDTPYNATTNADGTAAYTLVSPGVGIYRFGASFAGIGMNNKAVAANITNYIVHQDPSSFDSEFLEPVVPPTTGSVAISTRAQLENIKNNLSGKYHLVNDIDLSGTQWVPLGNNSTGSNTSRFTGIFDGQGHKILNLTITGGGYQYNGLFGYISGATIKNTGFTGTNINIIRSVSGTASTGTVYGYGSSNYQIYNCYNLGVVSTSTSAYDADSYVGGIGGDCLSTTSGSSILSCYNIAPVSSLALGSSSFSRAGGICANSLVSIENCYNEGDLYTENVNTSLASAAIAGGISAVGSGTINDCYNLGNISCSGGDYAAGILGNGSAVISGCYNSGNISNAGSAGGISGYLSRGSISNCYNTGVISGLSNAGGICGNFSGVSSTDTSRFISNCYNTGIISASTSSPKSGGIAGTFSYGSINNCYNTGSVSSISTSSSTSTSARAGGIAGDVTVADSVISCYNTGNVSVSCVGNTYAGGISGFMMGIIPAPPAGSISNCYWNSDSQQTINGASLTSGNKKGFGGIYGSGTDRTVSRTTAQLKQQSSLSGFDFNNVWEFNVDKNNGYPILRVFFSGDYKLLIGGYTFSAGNLSCKIKVTNFTENNKFAKLGVGVYAGNKLIGILFRCIELKKGKILSINDSISNLPELESYDIKAFLWDDNYTPLIESPNEVFVAPKSFEVDEVLQSAHPYTNNFSYTWEYTYPEVCESIDVTFSSDTKTESNYDYIYIYDKDNKQIGDRYSGTTLAGKTINIPGNTVKIKLTTDYSNTDYGFRTEKIVVNR